MGRLSEYDDVGRQVSTGMPPSTDRDEYLTRAYIDGRNAARDIKARTDIPDIYACDSLAAINWECGWDDYHSDMSDSKS